MRQRIPESVIITCDICNRKTGVTWKKNASIKYVKNGLDHLGDSVCDGTMLYPDICDDCETEISSAIEAVERKQRGRYGS
jgi:hypothetical protein